MNGVMESPNNILDARGQVVKYANVPPNLDPTYFFGFPRGGNVTTGDIDRHPYRHHPWVHACGWNFANKLSGIPRYLEYKGKKLKPEQDKWGILKRLSHPNPYMTQTTFLQIVILNLMLPAQRVFDAGGQCFILPLMAGPKKQCDLLKGQTPDVLMTFNDDHIRPKKDNNDSGMQALLGWEFYVSGKEQVTRLHLPHEIIRINFANPYDFLSGLSLYEPARLAVLSDIKSDVYNTRVFDNNAIPAGLLKSKDRINKNQRQELFQAWNEEYGGSGNAGKIAILGGDLEYQQISANQKDMEWQATKTDAFEKVVASFGLNKIALGKYENLNMATVVEGRKMLWEDGYIPTDALILEAINAQWLNYIDESLFLRSDYSKVPALKAGYKAQVEVMGLFINMGFTPKAAAQMADVSIPEEMLAQYPELDEKKPDATITPAPAGAGDNGPGGGIVVDNEPAAPKTHSHKKRAFHDVAYAAKIADLYEQRIFRPGEKAMQKMFVKYFAAQRSKMLDKVDSYAKALTGATKAKKPSAKDFLVSRKLQNEILYDDMKPFVKEQMKRVEAALKDQYGGKIEWNVTNEKVNAAMKRRADDIEQINGTTDEVAIRKITDAIEAGTEENLTAAEMAKDIREAIGEGMEIRKNHAMTIARTENGIISGETQFEALKESGFEYHRWVTANDEHVRDSHRNIETDTVPIGEPFTTGSGNTLLYPCDADGDAEEIINCRCIAIAVSNEEGEIYDSSEEN